MKKSTVALSAALALSLTGNVYLYREWAQKSAERTSYPLDQPLIDKSEALFRSELPDPSDEQLRWEMRPRFPVVSQIPDPREAGSYLYCVTLKLRDGVLGVEPVYCFDKRGNLVSKARV